MNFQKLFYWKQYFNSTLLRETMQPFTSFENLILGLLNFKWKIHKLSSKHSDKYFVYQINMSFGIISQTASQFYSLKSIWARLRKNICVCIYMNIHASFVKDDRTLLIYYF